MKTGTVLEIGMALAAIGVACKKDKKMTDGPYDRHYEGARKESGRFGRYLASRSTETWMFFVAGVFLGGFFF